MKPLAKRSTAITDHGAFSVWYKAKALEAQGKEIIHLLLGESDLDTPEHIITAGTRAMQNGRTRYAPASGTPELRQAITGYLRRLRGITANPQQVLVAPGVKAVLFFTLMALIEEGDEVLVPDPGFPAYTQITQLAGGRVVPYPLTAANQFTPAAAGLEASITPHTKCLILNSPHNPIGVVYNEETQREIAAVAQKHDLWVLSDEIYSQLYYTPAPPPSIYTLPNMAERTILMDGASKSHAMTGWRVGFGVYPAALIDPIVNMMVNDHSCLPPFIQDAAVVAFDNSDQQITTTRQIFDQRRQLMMAELDQLPRINYVTPEGAFYIYVDVSQLADAYQFTGRLLEAGVSVLPAAGFGRCGEGFIRLAFTQPEETLMRAMGIFRDVAASFER